jgi:peptidoglycan/xylan/chitin deacetylase (PgdA/CDA1 family)/GT2 family glycosyltransferase
MYHSISSSDNPLFQRWAVAPSLFNEHLDYLKQHHYSPITVTDLVRARADRSATLPARPVVLTFDDAYADFYDTAFPLLQRHGFPATLYVPTAYVGGACGWLRREGETMRPMATWSQLAEISAAGIECGGHSHNHVQMDAIPPAAVESEIRRCKSLLEDHLGQEVLSFAYPHGWTTSAVKRMIQTAGYASACAVKNTLCTPSDSSLELPRLVIPGNMDIDALAQALTHPPTHIEVTLRNVARPVWRFIPRSRVRLGLLPDALDDPPVSMSSADAATATATACVQAGDSRSDSHSDLHSDTASGASFEPAAMLEVEISRPFALDAPINPRTGDKYRRILALTRLHSYPLGLIEWWPDGGSASANQLSQRIWEALGPKINAHLRDDGLPEVVALGPEGLATAVTPPCLEAREASLAHAPFASVVIPTHNRPQQVAALVHSILASEYPPDRYEIIIVDNAPSTSATAQVVSQRFEHTNQVRYVREDRPGSSNARNRGLASAHGEIVVFADDDELVDAHWLSEMVRGFDGPIEVGCVTGLVVPMESETMAQGWFEQFGGYCKQQYARRIFNLTDQRDPSPLYPYNVGIFGAGGSMAFRRSILLGIGGFDPALGPATPTLGGEDVDTLLRIVLEGHAVLYEPAAIVRHPPHRQYAQLRDQIRGYGTGIAACLFKTMITKPRLLPNFIGKLPRGLLFALSPRSPHHAGKRAGYPRELTWLEFRGVLYGPVAYARSRFRLAHRASQARSSKEASRIATDNALGEAGAQGRAPVPQSSSRHA